MKFYDSQVFTNLSVGENSLEEMAQTAKALGYEAIVIADFYQGKEKLIQMLSEIEKVKIKGLEIVAGVTIDAKTPEEMKEILNKVRERVVLVIVKGGLYAVNRAACEDSRVDILINPQTGRLDNGLDEACLGLAKKNNIAIGISFRPILKSFRRSRSMLLQNIATNLHLAKEMGVRLVGCSGAQNKWEMREARQLIAVADSFGMSLGRGFSALTSTPQEMIEKNKKILLGEKVQDAEIIGDNNE